MELPEQIQTNLDRTDYLGREVQQTIARRDEAHISLGAAMRELRQSAGLSIEQLAAATPYSTSYIGQLEQGVRHYYPEIVYLLVSATDHLRRARESTLTGNAKAAKVYLF